MFNKIQGGKVLFMGFTAGSAVKYPPVNAEDVHLPIHWEDPLGRSSGKIFWRRK